MALSGLKKQKPASIGDRSVGTRLGSTLKTCIITIKITIILLIVIIYMYIYVHAHTYVCIHSGLTDGPSYTPNKSSTVECLLEFRVELGDLFFEGLVVVDSDFRALNPKP